MNKNPIVGLAYVVTSQQEMLEKASNDLEELKNKKFECKRGTFNINEIDNVLKEYDADYEALRSEYEKIESQMNDDAKTLSELRVKLSDMASKYDYSEQRLKETEEHCNDLEKNVDAVIEQHKQLKEKYFELQQSYDRHDLFRWMKWIPGMKIKTDICGLFPIVDGLYYYDESNTQKLYGNTETIDLKDCYGVNIVRMTNLNGYSECEIAPIDVEGATLVAVCVRYVRPYTAIKECPTIYDTPSHTFEDMFLEGMSPEDMTDLI